MKTGIKLLFIIGLLFGSIKILSQNKTDFDTTTWLLGDNTAITEFAGRKSLSGIAYLKNIEFLKALLKLICTPLEREILEDSFFEFSHTMNMNGAGFECTRQTDSLRMVFSMYQYLMELNVGNCTV